MRKITYRDINRRRIVRQMIDNHNIYAEASMFEKNADLYYEQFKKDKSKCDLLLKECANSPGASEKYFFDVLDKLTEAEDAKYVEYMAENVVKNLPVRFRAIDIPEKFASIKEAVMINNKCDSIIDNHNIMDNKFHIQENVSSLLKQSKVNDVVDQKLFAEVVMTTVDNTNIVIEGKVQIALREFFYLANKFNIPYDDKVVTEQIVNIAIASDKSIPTDTARLMKINGRADGNACIDTSKAVPDLCPLNDCDRLNQYINTLNDKFCEKIRAVDQIYTKLHNSCHGEQFTEDYKKSVELLFSRMSSMIRAAIDDNTLNRKDLIIIADMTNHAIEKMVVFLNHVVGVIGPTLKDNFTYMLGNMRRFLANIEDIERTSYDHSNIAAMNEAVDWNKIFKKENLVNAVKIADDRLNKKFQELTDKGVKKIKKIKRWIFNQDTDVKECMMVDGSIDYVVESWICEDDKSISNDIEEFCKYENSTSLYGTGFKMYFEALNNLIEFHLIGDSVCVDESFDEEYISSSLASYLFEVEQFNEAFDELVVPDRDQIAYFVQNNSAYAPYIIELCAYAGIDIKDAEYIMTKSSLYMDSSAHLSESNNTFDKYNILAENITDPILALEAMHMLSEVVFSKEVEEPLEEEGGFVKVTKDPKRWVKASEKKGNMKDQVQNNLDADKKNTKSGLVTKDAKDSGKDTESEDEKKEKKPLKIDLNSLTLAMHGFKKKIKDLGAKEQQASRNLDAAFNMFYKSVKNMLVSDRREAIIKGSVIPSFSRCLKIAAGLGITAAFSPVTAMIALIGGIAVSKNLTKKERALLMDEIETEIEVLDKEIANAEAKNQLKKLRALLKTKKDLQRQYQRIKYNIRIGKDLVPSTAGTPGNGD